MRLYFQAGVFVYRRGIGFSQHYLDTCTKALDARFGFAHNAEHFTDQVRLGLSMFSAGLRWKQLPFDHNFPVASFLPPSTRPHPLSEARILHYHDSMEVSQWPGLLARLEEAHPTSTPGSRRSGRSGTRPRRRGGPGGPARGEGPRRGGATGSR